MVIGSFIFNFGKRLSLRQISRTLTTSQVQILFGVTSTTGASKPPSDFYRKHSNHTKKLPYRACEGAKKGNLAGVQSAVSWWRVHRAKPSFFRSYVYPMKNFVAVVSLDNTSGHDVPEYSSENSHANRNLSLGVSSPLIRSHPDGDKTHDQRKKLQQSPGDDRQLLTTDLDSLHPSLNDIDPDFFFDGISKPKYVFPEGFTTKQYPKHQNWTSCGPHFSQKRDDTSEATHPSTSYAYPRECVEKADQNHSHFPPHSNADEEFEIVSRDRAMCKSYFKSSFLPDNNQGVKNLSIHHKEQNVFLNDGDCTAYMNRYHSERQSNFYPAKDSFPLNSAFPSDAKQQSDVGGQFQKLQFDCQASPSKNMMHYSPACTQDAYFKDETQANFSKILPCKKPLFRFPSDPPYQQPAEQFRAEMEMHRCTEQEKLNYQRCQLLRQQMKINSIADDTFRPVDSDPQCPAYPDPTFYPYKEGTQESDSADRFIFHRPTPPVLTPQFSKREPGGKVLTFFFFV